MIDKSLELKKLVEKSDTIYLTSHISPDMDSIGSLLGLNMALKNKYRNKTIKMVLKDKVPKKFNFLDIKNIEQIDVYNTGELLILLDCADKNRIGIDGLENIETIVNIDHHISNPNYGDLNIVDIEASSTSEIVFELLKTMEIETDIDINRALYAGISADTGSFKYSNTTSRTHAITSELLKEDIGMNEINVRLYQNRSLEDIEVLKKILEKMFIIEDNKIAGIVFKERDYKNILEKDSLEGIVEFGRDIEGVEVSFFLKEDEGFIKGSLRSKNYLDVAEIASHFQGGGHTKASGFKTKGNIDDVKEEVIKIIKSRL